MRSVPDGGGWSARRAPLRRSYGLEPSRPTRPAYVDLEELASWNAANQRARDAAYNTAADAYATRITASEKTLRYRRRKAAAS